MFVFVYDCDYNRDIQYIVDRKIVSQPGVVRIILDIVGRRKEEA